MPKSFNPRVGVEPFCEKYLRSHPIANPALLTIPTTEVVFAVLSSFWRTYPPRSPAVFDLPHPKNVQSVVQSAATGIATQQEMWRTADVIGYPRLLIVSAFSAVNPSVSEVPLATYAAAKGSNYRSRGAAGRQRDAVCSRTGKYDRGRRAEMVDTDPR
jgi:hypothetical protein